MTDQPLPFGIDLQAISDRFAFSKPGMRLVNACLVGLPVYELPLTLLVQEVRPIPPLQEFAMKAIDEGLGHPDHVAAFLGLGHRSVRRVLSDLTRTEDVHLAATATQGHQYLALTQKGKRTLSLATLSMPQDFDVNVKYDGLSREVVALTNEALLFPKDLRDLGIPEIPACPARPPLPKEILVASVERIAQQLRKGRTQIREVLAVRSVGRTKRLYRPGVALVFRRGRSDDVQVMLVHDGRVREDYSAAFAKSKAAVRLGIVKEVVDGDDASRRAVDALGLSLPPVAPAEEVLKREQDVASAREALVAAKEKTFNVPAAAIDSVAPPPPEVVAAQNQLEGAQARLDELPVRHIHTPDHPALLERAFLKAEQRLLLVSPWISADVVDRTMLRRLQVLLIRGCQVTIGWGIGDPDADRQMQKPRNRETVRTLEQIANQFKGRFRFVRLGDTHAKVLVVDRSFCVVSSFNWLSFRGDPDRTFRDEQGVYITIPEVVDDVYDKNMRRVVEANG